jgi:DNA repair exonuclease SbcCD ATPase subunit
MVVENFLSFGKAEFNFEGSGLTLVEGENLDDESARSNGSGKSAMIDALVWCLFGTTLRGYENDEVVHRKVGEDCLVTVDLEDEHSTYRVSRARRHARWKNTLTVSTQGADASGSSNTETQEIVEKLLGCSKRTFLSSVVFGQDRAYRFSSLTDKEQKEILDEVLGMERFSQACATARAKLTEINTARDNIQRDLERAEELRDQSTEEAEGLREKDGSFEGERKGKIKAERERLTKAKEWVKKNAKVDVTDAALNLSATRGAIAGCEKKVDKARDAEADARSARSAGEQLVEDLEAHIKGHEKLMGSCPTCKQPVDEKKRKAVVADLKKKLGKASLDLGALGAAAEDTLKQLTSIKRKLQEARDADLIALKVHNEAVGAEANVKVWKQRVADHEKRIAELEKETNPYSALAKRVETKRDKYGKESELLTEQLKGEEARAKLADFWVKAFGAKGLRSLLLDTSLPLLNEEASRISRAVTGGSISIEFSATSDLKSGKTVDKFEVRVDNKHGAGTYQGNSAGERAKVDLCVGLALQRLVASRSSASFNVIFFDEVFDHLDGAAHERVVDVLSEIDKDSVFVVSHDEDLKAWFPASLRVVKKGGFSTVES